jgi:hypothetical protein
MLWVRRLPKVDGMEIAEEEWVARFKKGGNVRV